MTECLIEGCDYPAKTRGWCQAHYMRWYTTGDTGSANVQRRSRGRKCSVPGCGRKHQGRGFCDGHLRRFIQTGAPGPAEFERRNPGAPCVVVNCERRADGGYEMCEKHYQRWRKHGDALAAPTPYQWTGDEASYGAVHFRLRKSRGKASALSCVRCGSPAEHWSYDHSDPRQKIDPGGRPYSTDLSRYRPMCAACHRQMDAERTRAVGCSVEGCDGPHKARGMCNRHYRRWLAESG